MAVEKFYVGITEDGRRDVCQMSDNDAAKALKDPIGETGYAALEGPFETKTEAQEFADDT